MLGVCPPHRCVRPSPVPSGAGAGQPLWPRPLPCWALQEDSHDGGEPSANAALNTRYVHTYISTPELAITILHLTNSGTILSNVRTKMHNTGQILIHFPINFQNVRKCFCKRHMDSQWCRQCALLHQATLKHCRGWNGISFPFLCDQCMYIPANHPGFSRNIPRFQHRFRPIFSIPTF